MNHVQNTLFLQRALASIHNLKSEVTQCGHVTLQMERESQRELNNGRASSSLTRGSNYRFPKRLSVQD